MGLASLVLLSLIDKQRARFYILAPPVFRGTPCASGWETAPGCLNFFLIDPHYHVCYLYKENPFSDVIRFDKEPIFSSRSRSSLEA